MTENTGEHVGGEGTRERGPAAKAYSTLWSIKDLAAGATTVAEMADRLQAAAEELRKMHEAGVRLEGADDDCACLVTNDPDVADAFGFDDEDDEPEDDPVGYLRWAIWDQLLDGFDPLDEIIDFALG